MTTSHTQALTAACGVGPPSLAAPWGAQLETWLGEERCLPGVELLRRARQAGYRGGKSALYELIRRLRAPALAPLGRFEGVPGEFSQHDFGQVDVRYTSGAVERVHFLASRLKWSRVVDVVLVPDEREETLIRGLLAALEVFGGVPLVTVWDNPKTVVVSRTGARIVRNPIFGQVALDYRFAPELGQQKGGVENLVGWVKGKFFKCRRFHDRADLEAQLAQWLSEVNTRRPEPRHGGDSGRPSRAGAPAAARAADRARRLRADDPGRRDCPGAGGVRRPRILDAPGEPRPARHAASVSGSCRDRHPRRQRIRHAGRLARGQVSLLPEHRAAMLGAGRGRRARLYYQQQSLWELGAAAETWLTELVHRRPAHWAFDVEQGFALLQQHGPTRMLAAFAQGVRQRAIGAEYVRAHLSGTAAQEIAG